MLFDIACPCALGKLFGLTARNLEQHIGHRMVIIGTYPDVDGAPRYGQPELTAANG